MRLWPVYCWTMIPPPPLPALELLCRYHYILLMDCTYKTSRYGIDIIGVAPVNKSFLFDLGSLRSLLSPFCSKPRAISTGN